MNDFTVRDCRPHKWYNEHGYVGFYAGEDKRDYFGVCKCNDKYLYCDKPYVIYANERMIDSGLVSGKKVRVKGKGDGNGESGKGCGGCGCGGCGKGTVYGAIAVAAVVAAAIFLLWPKKDGDDDDGDGGWFSRTRLGVWLDAWRASRAAKASRAGAVGKPEGLAFLDPNGHVLSWEHSAWEGVVDQAVKSQFQGDDPIYAANEQINAHNTTVEDFKCSSPDRQNAFESGMAVYEFLVTPPAEDTTDVNVPTGWGLTPEEASRVSAMWLLATTGRENLDPSAESLSNFFIGLVHANQGDANHTMPAVDGADPDHVMHEKVNDQLAAGNKEFDEFALAAHHAVPTNHPNDPVIAAIASGSYFEAAQKLSGIDKTGVAFDDVLRDVLIVRLAAKEVASLSEAARPIAGLLITNAVHSLESSLGGLNLADSDNFGIYAQDSISMGKELVSAVTSGQGPSALQKIVGGSASAVSAALMIGRMIC